MPEADIQVNWHQFIRNEQTPASDIVTRHINAIGGHIARLHEDTSSQSSSCQVSVVVGRPPSEQRRRRPRPTRFSWIDQIQRDNKTLGNAISRGHRGATLRPTLATWWWPRIIATVTSLCTSCVGRPLYWTTVFCDPTAQKLLRQVSAVSAQSQRLAHHYISPAVPEVEKKARPFVIPPGWPAACRPPAHTRLAKGRTFFTQTWLPLCHCHNR